MLILISVNLILVHNYLTILLTTFQHINLVMISEKDNYRMSIDFYMYHVIKLWSM